MAEVRPSFAQIPLYICTLVALTAEKSQARDKGHGIAQETQVAKQEWLANCLSTSYSRSTPLPIVEETRVVVYGLLTGWLVPLHATSDGLTGTSWRPAGAKYSMGQTNSRYICGKRKEYERSGINPPRNYSVAHLATNVSLNAVFVEFDQGFFLVKASNLATAYRALDAVSGAVYYISGDSLDSELARPRLVELRKMPQPSWSSTELVENLAKSDKAATSPINFHLLNLPSGRIVPLQEMSLLGPMSEFLYAHDRVSGALNHLGHSRALFNGFMVDSYYQFHYKDERRAITKRLLTKRALENRIPYEMSFLSAFKGVERLLGTTQIKKHQIPTLLSTKGYGVLHPDTKYQRDFEFFSGFSKFITYEGLIEHFLDIRNAVAAHANPSAPSSLQVSEDTVREVQLFLCRLCRRILQNIQPRSLPKKARSVDLWTKD